VDQGFAVVSQLDLLADYCEECGELFEIDLLEVYPEERAFQFSTCCEWSQACALDEVRGGSRSPFIRELFARYGIDVRQVYVDETGWLRLDYGLHLEPVDLKTAKAFVAKHHRHNRPPVGWKWGHAVYNGHELVAVAMVGRPVARMIDHKTTVEVNRVCVDPDLDKALVWNACSMLYGEARREARRRGYKTVVTYTLETEAATTLKAVGWRRAARTKGGSWNVPSRPRKDAAPTGRKIRWEALA
jgi:hypothetical protein